MRMFHRRFIPFLLSLFLVLCMFGRLTPQASADTSIQKILTTISATPVALMDPASITAATSTPGLSITSAGWFDASGKALSGVFQPETYKIEIHVKADNGYVIASDVAAYLNNSAVTIQLENGGKSATLVREYTAAIWAPTIIKSPSAETVKEGGWASFAASASYVRGYEWYLEGPDGRQAVSVDDLHLTYPELSATGNGSSKMNLYHIPYDLNGWKVVCNFIGAGNSNSVKSQGALLTVIPTVSRPADSADASSTASNNATQSEPAAAAVSPSPSGSETSGADNSSAAPAAGQVDTASEPGPTTEPAAENGTPDNGNTADAGDPTPAETPNTEPSMVYANVWSYDARGHWHDSIGADPASRANEALHSFVWYSAEDGTQTGVCDVCGYTLTRSPASSPAAGSTASANKADPDSSAQPVTKESTPKPSLPMILLMALAPIDIALVAGHAVRSSGKSRHSK